MGSGDFHHLTVPLVVRQAGKRPLSVVVFDRHLDAFPAPEGFVSCGSWIREVVKLPTVQRVLVIGSTEKPAELPSKTIALPFQAICQRLARGSEYFDGLLNADDLYISVDKDVFGTALTNWGRGEISVVWVFTFLRWCMENRQLVGVDVCGEFIPRGLWPTVEERRALARNERINIAFCQFFMRWKRKLLQKRNKKDYLEGLA